MQMQDFNYVISNKKHNLFSSEFLHAVILHLLQIKQAFSLKHFCLGSDG